jgi:hypothetical protein
MNNRFPQIIKSIGNIENPVTESLNIIKTDINILNTTPKYSIAQCISADLLHNTELSNKITQKYGNMSFILENIELIPGGVTTIDTELRTIHYLVTRDKHDAPISYLDIFDNLYNLKNSAIQDGHEFIALSRTNLTNNQLQWEIIQNMIYEIFDKTQINILIGNTHEKQENKNSIISNIKKHIIK